MQMQIGQGIILLEQVRYLERIEDRIYSPNLSSESSAQLKVYFLLVTAWLIRSLQRWANCLTLGGRGVSAETTWCLCPN